MTTTSTSITPSPGSLPAGLLEVDAARVEAAIAEARSPATRRAYASAWALWTSWCLARGVQALPAAPEHVAAWIAERAAEGRSHATIAVGLAAIGAEHRDRGLADPAAHVGVRRTAAGLRRARPGPPDRVDALAGEDLERALARLPDTRGGRRDGALMLLARDTLARRSELAALDWGDLSPEPDGSGRLVVRVSKTDQAGEGATLYVTDRTMRALEKHAVPADSDPGEAIFVALRGPRAGRRMSGRAVGEIIQRAAASAGLEGRYGGHSTRRGSAAALVEGGATAAEVMLAGRWSTPRMIAVYAAGAEAGRGAVARIFGGRSQTSQERA